MAGEDLLVEIGLSEGKYRQALARLEAQTLKSAKASEKSFAKSNANISKSFSAANAGANAFSKNGLRNVSLQLSQVAQQGSATGNYMQALAIQLPDLALGFGTIGIAAGVAAGALLPLITNMVTGGKEAKTLDETMSALDKSLGAYKEAVKTALSSSEDLTAEFGSMTEEIRGTLQMLQQLALQDALTGLTEGADGVADAMNKINDAVNAIANGEASRYWKRQLEDLGLTLGQAQSLRIAFDNLAAAEGPQAIAEAARALNDKLLAVYGSAAKIPPEMRKIAQAAGETEKAAAAIVTQMERTEISVGDVVAAVGMMGAGLGNAIGNAEALAGRMQSVAANAWEAASAWAQAKANMTLDDATAGGPDAARRDVMNTYTPGGVRRDAMIGGPWRAPDRPRTGGGGRSSGGGGGGGGSVDPNLAEAKSLYDETRTEAEKYATELATINDLYESGYINGETYNRAIEMIAEKYGTATAAGEQFAELNAMLKDSILDFAENGVDALDDLAEALRKAALEALLFGSGPLGALLGGGGKGLIGGLASFDGGGFTGGGGRSGGIDGKGGFPAILHPNETVIDHTRGGGSGGRDVNVSVSVDNNGNLQAYVDRVSAGNTARGLKQYDRNVAPKTIGRARRDPRRIG